MERWNRIRASYDPDRRDTLPTWMPDPATVRILKQDKDWQRWAGRAFEQYLAERLHADHIPTGLADDLRQAVRLKEEYIQLGDCPAAAGIILADGAGYCTLRFPLRSLPADWEALAGAAVDAYLEDDFDPAALILDDGRHDTAPAWLAWTDRALYWNDPNGNAPADCPTLWELIELNERHRWRTSRAHSTGPADILAADEATLEALEAMGWPIESVEAVAQARAGNGPAGWTPNPGPGKYQGESALAELIHRQTLAGTLDFEHEWIRSDWTEPLDEPEIYTDFPHAGLVWVDWRQFAAIEAFGAGLCHRMWPGYWVLCESDDGFVSLRQPVQVELYTAPDDGDDFAEEAGTVQEWIDGAGEEADR